MDAKAMKAALKSAVEHIKGERFSDTAKICKEILKSSPNNSRALVFLGVAAEGLGDSAHALEAHKKAISTAAEDDLLPWQGLCTFYEKHAPKSAEDLTAVYEKLISLPTSNRKKQEEIRVKLCTHLLLQSNFDKQVVGAVQSHCSQLGDPQQQYKVWVALATYCLTSDGAEAKEQFHSICSDLFSKSSFVEEERNIWEVYVQHSYQGNSDTQQVVKLCLSLADSYPSSSVMSDVLAELYCQICAGLPSIDPVPLQQAVHTELLSDSMAEIYVYAKDSQSLSTAFSADKVKASLSCYAYIALARQNLEDKDYKKTKECLDTATKRIDKVVACLEQCKVTYKSMISDYSIQLAFKQHNYCEVIRLCTQGEVRGHREEYIISLIETDNIAQAEQLLHTETEEDKALLGYLYKTKGMYEKSYELLASAVTSHPKSTNINLWLGQVCMEISCREKEVAKYLLTAAKLNPENEDAFLHLGYYYNKVGDVQRGMKCIKKGYSLNPIDDQICTAYVDQLMAQGENEQVVQILSQTTRLSPSGSCKWAWFRLGSLRSNEGNLTEAINCFQQALRADEGDSNCWECLADCYVKRGSFTAAIGAFEQAFQLNSKSIYSCYQIALTKYRLFQYADAQQLFLDLLKQMPDYVPALKGLGDVHIAIAKDAIKDSIYGKICSNISQSLLYLAEAALLRPDLSCVWKSLGDAFTLCYQLPAHSIVQCPSAWVNAGGDQVPKASTLPIDVPKALAIGARCYAQCKHLRVDNSFAWHDLAVNYVYQSQLCPEAARRKSLLHAASQFALKAISLDKQVVAHYNCLGAIYMHADLFDALAAQHYLILSVELDQSNVQGWTNLAALYLMQGDITLAHETLNIAQSADPKYNECWTGQAIVAEMIGHEEAMDLFRHTTELGKNVESAVGYAHWVLKTLIEGKGTDSEHFRYSIEKLEAVTVSCDALGSLIGWKCTAQSLNAYGLLLERQGLLNMAAKALQQCVTAAAEANDSNLSLYRANLARVLCCKKDYQQCLQQLQLISSPSLHDTAVTALTHYKLGNFTDSFQCYNELVELTGDDVMRGHVYAAMGMLAVKCGDTDTAKTAFFQCSQSSSPSIYGLAGLCSLALLSGDGQLAVAALAELVKCTNSKDAYILKCTFNSYMCALKGDTKSARNHLLRAIHCYPTDRQLHNQLLTLSINYLPGYRDSILRLTHAISSVKDLVAVISLASGDVRKSLRQAQSALHLNPGSQSTRLLLLGASYSAHNLGIIPSQVVSSLLEYLNSHADCGTMKEGLKRWLAEMDLFFTVQSNTGRLEFVSNKHSKQLSGSTVMAKLAAFINKDMHALNSMDNDALNLRLQVKLRGSSRDTLADIKQREDINEPQLQTLKIMEAKLMLQEMIDMETDELKDQFFSLLNGIHSGSSQFLQALYYWKVDGKMRTAVRVFETVLAADQGRDTKQYQMAGAFLQQHKLEKPISVQ